MDLIDFLEQVSSNKGKPCVIKTTTGIYEGVCLGHNGQQVILRPTGQTQKMLNGIGRAENSACNPAKECGIRVDHIINIEFSR